jgi:hypothetical protein
VGVVDGKQQRSLVGQVGGQPVQPMQGAELRVPVPRREPWAALADEALRRHRQLLQLAFALEQGRSGGCLAAHVCVGCRPRSEPYRVAAETQQETPMLRARRARRLRGAKRFTFVPIG